MNYKEMQTETVESAADTEVTTEVDLSAFDDGWDDDGLYQTFEEDVDDMDEVTSGEADADQQEADDAEAFDSTEEPENGEEQSDDSADQLMTVKHLDSVREFDWRKDKDEIQTFVQKGMDYDRKVSKLNAKVAEYEDFLKEFAEPSGLTIEHLMDSARARMLMRKKSAEGDDISEADAIFQVQKARAEKAASKQEAKEQPAEVQQNATPTEVSRFLEVYPNVKAEDIPQSVWDDVKKTGDLLGAYTRYENAELKRKMTVLETNKKNEMRSTGSRKTAGASKPRDAFDEGWDSI